LLGAKGKNSPTFASYLMIIFLIGFMGSGKSHLGKELAALMKYKFVDTDAVIEEKKKKTVAEIFSVEGEESFRAMEKKTLQGLLKKSKTVIATGGGMPCHDNNIEPMNKNGITVYLEAGVGFLFHRLMNEKKERPLISNLSDIELMEYISGTLNNRKPFYEQCRLKVNAEKITAEKLKEKIKNLKMS
jgi:shikimate kinase